MAPMLRAALLASVALAVVVPSLPREAAACGGAFYPPPASATQAQTELTDHRMAIAMSPTMTTLWDQIEYSGDPGQFAWVLPIRGPVLVGLGDQGFLDQLDKATQLQLKAPYRTCAYMGSDGCAGGTTAGCAANDLAMTVPGDAGADDGVVAKTEVVGPYATAQIYGKDNEAIVKWLRGHAFAVSDEAATRLGAYVKDGFGFLAVRLAPKTSVRAMRPIRVTWKGALTSFPLRLAGLGASGPVGLKLFVIGDGRWRTKGEYPTATIDPLDLTWDFPAAKSNFPELRDQTLAKLGRPGFLLESSVDLAPSAFPAEEARSALPGDDDAGVPDAGGDSAVSDAASSDAEASEVGASDASPIDSGKVDLDPATTDVEIAFGTLETRRVTRLRGSIAAKDLNYDLTLEADPDARVLAPQVQITRASKAPVCPGYSSIATSGQRPVRLGALLALAALGAVLARRASRSR